MKNHLETRREKEIILVSLYSTKWGRVSREWVNGIGENNTSPWSQENT